MEITHRALVNFLESMRKEPGFTADDVLLAVTTVSFDIAALELLLPLTPVRPFASLSSLAIRSLLADLERYRPTVMQATPATWKLLIAAGWKGDQRLKILCGGEALDTDLARSLLVRSESLWNMYGPTETTIWSAVLRLTEAGAERNSNRTAHPEHLLLYSRFIAAAGATGRARRTLDWRRRPGSRISESPRFDSRAIYFDLHFLNWPSEF